MTVTKEQIDAAAEYHAKTKSGHLSGTFFWHELIEEVLKATTPAQLAAMLEAGIIAERAGQLRALADAIEPLVALFDDEAVRTEKIWPTDSGTWTADRNNWGKFITIAMMRELRRVYRLVMELPKSSLPYVRIPQLKPPDKM
jgi:hypothetical protein